MENSSYQRYSNEENSVVMPHRPGFLELTNKLASQWGVNPETFANWRWQMKNQIRTLEDAKPYLKLDPHEEEGYTELKKFFNSGITPYYLGLIKEFPQNLGLRYQVIPRINEKFDLKGINDPLEEVAHSPVKEVVHVYPDRVAFCVAMLCPVYCRYCYRKRRDDEEGLHFNRNIISRGIEYISSNSSIKDVLITGGDPFIASDQTIENL